MFDKYVSDNTGASKSRKYHLFPNCGGLALYIIDECCIEDLKLKLCKLCHKRAKKFLESLK